MIETEQEFMRFAVLQDPMFFGNAAPSDFKEAVETIEALREVVQLVIVECERPENRGRMTQRQQADFLDSVRATIKDALPDWLLENE